MEIQRAHLIDEDGIAGRYCAIGGFAQLTNVTAESVTASILHRWREDAVGSKLGQRSATRDL